MTTFNQIVKPGNTNIYYVKKDSFRDFCLGNKLPNLADLSKTHALLGTTELTDKEDIYALCQEWQNNGQANDFMENLDIAHTSMSIGDLIEIDGTFYMVDRAGFTVIKKSLALVP